MKLLLIFFIIVCLLSLLANINKALESKGQVKAQSVGVATASGFFAFFFGFILSTIH